MTKLKTFSTLEEAVLALQDVVTAQGYVDTNSNKAKRDLYPARYDFAPINSLAKQIGKNIGLTDRQQEMAIKLVTKYRKQWKKIGYDVSNIDLETPLENPLRVDVDREHLISATQDKITLKFPYKPNLIGLMSQHQGRACGTVTWNKPALLWELAITADNVTWASRFADHHGFERHSTFTELEQEIRDAFDYKSICLDIVNDELVIKNAPPTMLKWIENNVGDISFDNFIRLVGLSDILIFSLSQKVVKYTYDNYSDI